MSNSIKQLMLELIKQGIRFKLNGDKVKLEGDLSALSNDIKTQLRQHKDEIVALVKKGQQASAGFSLTKAPQQGPTLLSYAQQRLWFIDKLEQGSPEYNMPLALDLHGELDSDSLSKAIDALGERHDVLASRFIEQDDGVYAIIDPSIKPQFQRSDLSAAKDPDQQFEQLALEDAQTPFNLNEPPFLRVHLLKLSASHWGFLLNCHHIVTDGWSEQLLIDELFTLYQAFAAGAPNPLPALDWQYRDYAWSQRQWLKGEALEHELGYWRQRLENLPQVHSLNLDTPARTRPAMQSFNGKSLSTKLDNATTAALNQLCLAQDVTLFMLLESAFALLLARLSGESDIAIGTPVSGRNISGIEPLVGCFLNTLVLRNQLDLNADFLTLLRHNKQHILTDFEHQNLPFELLVESINPERSLSHAPLFQIFFTLNQGQKSQQPTQSLHISPRRQAVTSTKFDLSLVAFHQSGEPLQLGWTFNTALFSVETVSLFAQRFEVLLKALIATPNQPVGTLLYQTPNEQAQLAQFAQGKALSAAPHNSLSLWFEQQVSQTPKAIAISDGTSTLCYEQLNCRANAIAHALCAQGAKPGDLVAVLLERHCDLVASLLAVLKTGAGYVPVDPDYPLERCHFIVDDAKAKLVLSNQKQQARFARADSNYVLLDALGEQPQHNLDTNRQSHQEHQSASATAYVIYTSGSTGKPKGVEISHANALALVSWAQDYYPAEALSKVAATTSVCFDLSIFELFVPLLTGNQVVLFDNGLAIDPSAEVSLINTVPSVMQALVAEKALPPSLKVINLAGEALKRTLVDSIFAAMPEVHLFNLYGPSEDTTYSSVAQMLPHQQDIPDIGRPIAGSCAQVLDLNGNAVGIGVTGELYLSGQGVAKGYLHQPDLTLEKFTPQGYRTGDLVRWRYDGKLDYIGRADRQVKLRGFRIEPGEIEALLSRQTGVTGAAVKVVNDSLVAWLSVEAAWLTGQAQQSADSRLRQAVAASLPSHMQPSTWLYLPKLPTTSNGKIDYNALPLPSQDEPKRTVAPQGEIEQRLFGIWQALLGHEHFGVEDNFFSLGGDSILSIQVVSRAKAQGLHFSVRQLFEAQNIAALAQLCQTEQQRTIEQTPLGDDYALLPIQQDFFAQKMAVPHHYNQGVLLKTPAGLTPSKLASMLTALLTRHDALRLVFASPQQGKFAPLDLCLEIDSTSHLGSDALTERCSAHQASLNYQQGPLFKAVYFPKYEGGRLLLIGHHLVVDGVSWRIILSDLESLWHNHSLGLKTHSIDRWQQALCAYLPKAQNQRDFWQAQWQQSRNYLPNHHQAQQLQSQFITLSAPLTEQLLQQAHQAYRTEVPDILLASLLKAWQQFSGQPSLVIALEGHGREPQVLDKAEPLDLTETVGWFTTLYPLALKTALKASQSARIIAVKETLRQVPDKGLGYGVLRYLGQDASLAAAERYDDTLVFNYLGQFDVAQKGQSAFTSASESMGAFSAEQNRLRHLFGLNGMISQGQLQFAISFDANRISSDKVAEFAKFWQQALSDDIVHGSEASMQLTPSDFPYADVDSDTLSQLQQAYPRLSNLYRATPMQQGLMFHGLYDGEQTAQAYTTQTYFDLTGALNTDTFGRAWSAVIARHDILRTAFVGQTTGRIQQLVVEPFDCQIELLDWREHDGNKHDSDKSTAQAEALAQFRAQDKAKGFDFAKPPLLRLTLIRLASERWHLVWSHHHVLLDGWCLPLVFGEVMTCYHSFNKNQAPQLPQVEPYHRYIKWLSEQDQDSAKAYWQQQLSGFYQNQPIDKTFAALAQFHQGEVQISATEHNYREQQLVLPQALCAQLHTLIAQANTTLNLLLQAAWSTLVSRFSAEQQVLFGTTVSGRPAELSGVEHMVGLFINTLPVAVNVDPAKTLGEFLTELSEHNLERQNHGFLSLGDIAAQSTMAASELFDTLVVVENFPVSTADSEQDSTSAGQELSLENIGGAEHTNYPLALICHQRQQISIKFGYQSDKFSDATIARLMELTQASLAQLSIATLATPLAALSPLSEQDSAKLTLWGQARTQYPAPKSVVARFEQCAQHYPQHIALSDGERQLSYAALNHQANRLAHYLISQGVGPETVVGIHVEPSTSLLVAMLAILKAGGAYLPLVAELPAERMAYMLSDCAVDLVLCQSHLQPSIGVNTLCLDSQHTTGMLASYPQTNPQVPGLSGQSLAYIIYTSGSTGLPKGVRIEHHQVARLLAACEADVGPFTQQDVWTLFHGYGFDFSVWEIWGALAYGARLVIVPKALTREPQAFAQLLTQQQVSVLNQTPSAFYPLIEHLPEQHSLRQVIFGGEALNYSLLRPWFERGLGKQCRLINMYGITETCVHATFKQVNDEDCYRHQPSTIGRALADLTFRVCDPSGALQVPGAPGELWIGGDGVARDYLNRAQLTQEKFVSHQGMRYYRSGDSVRWCANGELDYLGRIDQQVKIRGFRIELGEIEARLSALEHIDNVAVLARNDDGKGLKLVAYLATPYAAESNPGALDIEQVKAALGKDLPSYMIPALYVQLATLPLTINGKIDRKALPKPQESDRQKAEHIGAQTPLQQQLVELWQQVLGLNQVGIADNFFRLGGDSIIAIQLVARARQQGLQMSVKQLFEQPTISALSAVVAASANTRVHAKAEGALDLLPIHHDFFAQRLAAPHHFNQALLLDTPKLLSLEQLEQIIAQLLERHDGLRLVFNQATTPIQGHYLSTPKPLLSRFDHYSEQTCNDIQSSFDLSQGPLAKFAWFEQDNKLLVCLHHLIVDGVSWRILLDDINAIFAGMPLAPRPMSQQSWAKALATYANSPKLNAQRDFWQAQDSAHRLIDTGERTQGALRAVSMRLSTAQTKALLGPSHTPYNTRINDLLLAALVKATDQPQLLIELEGHGREALFADIDISETLGWFTTVYPVLLEAQANWSDTIIAVKEKLRQVPDGGIGYGVLRYLAKTPISTPTTQGLLFNYLGQFDSSLSGQSAFSGATESVGQVSSTDNRPSHPLTLNGMVEGGQLGFNLNYDSGLIEQAQATALLERYEQALIDCIAHCQQAKKVLSPADFTEAKASLTQLRQWQQRYPAMSALYVATPMQTGLLFHGMMDSDDPSALCGSDYSTQTILTLKGQVDSQALHLAWQQVVARHDILRTAFVGIGEGVIHQLVCSAVSLPYSELDWRNQADNEQKLAAFLAQDKRQGFDFASAPLMRVTLIRQTDALSTLVWTHHHSLLDGWCLPLIFKDLGEYYRAERANTCAQLAQVAPYQSYIAWLKQQDEAKAIDFWQQQLSGFDAPIELCIKKPVAKDALGSHQNQRLSLSLELSQKLNQVARHYQVTQSTLVQAAWAILLGQYSNSEDVVFGVTVSGRPAELPGIEQMVGLFINTIPVRVKLNPNTSLEDLLTPLQQDNLTRESFSFLSLAQIQNQAKRQAGQQGSAALFESLVIFENYPVDEALSHEKALSSDTSSAEDFIISAARSDEQTNYALTLLAHQAGETLEFNLGYRQGQFKQSSIKRLLTHFEHILSQLAKHQPLGQITLLTESEQAQLTTLSQPAIHCGPYVGLVARFEQQVATTPDAIAISCHGQTIDYKTLLNQVNLVALQLKNANVQSEVIGIYLERSINMVVAMLAVLKAGYAYLPLDSGYPSARLLEMAKDSQLDYLIADKPLSAQLNWLNLNDSLKTQSASASNWAYPPSHAPAYRIYTSGSTGKPKGVTLSHGNVCALIDWAHQFYRPEQLAVVAAVTPISFDISVFELFVPLTCGGRVALMQNALSLDDDSITLLNTVPSVLKAAMQEQPLPPSLKAINLAGEPLPQALVDSIDAHLAENVPVYNLYGPSEDTVYSTGAQVFPGQTTAPPIGRPVAGSCAYVLDNQLRQVPIGVTGELYLGGLGVGLGYHQRPELNQASFIASPFKPQQKLYKTGDLVRWREDGQLDYVGRSDNQVKLRGLRIELGEVENRLQALVAQTPCAVVMQHNQLLAFIAKDLDTTTLKQQLKANLPGHMVPDRFFCIPMMPLNANGKIDRKKLLEALPEQSSQSTQQASSPTEQVLCDIWQGLLQRQSIGVDEDFFALGGDSIIAIQVVTRARRQGLRLTVRALFEHSTIASLAAYIEQNADAQGQQSAEQGRLSGSAPLLPIQRDFFAQALAEPNHYNQTLLLCTPATLSEAQCAALIDALVAKHDALRLQFNAQGGEYAQSEHSPFEVVQVSEIERTALSDSCQRYQRSLDIAKGPLFKAVYFKAAQGQGRLLLTIHHLAVDGVSWRILLDDLRASWQAIAQAKTPSFGQKTHSTRQWQQALSQLDLSAQLDYWQSQLCTKALPFIKASQGHTPLAHVEGLTLSLNKLATAALLGEGLRPYKTTTEELLLAALLKAGLSWSGGSELAIELESHGRETAIVDDAIDLSETVGWFTALYPLKLSYHAQSAAEHQQWPNIIRAVKNQLRAIPNKGLGFGVLKYLQGHALPQQHRGILFNYLGQLDSLSGGNASADTDAFTLAPEPAGMPVSESNRPANPLSINAHISEGCLQVAIHADTSVLPAEYAARFTEYYQQALYQCIEHCQSAQTQLTLADFANAKVDEATLQQWLTAFPKLDKLYPATPMQQGILFHCLLGDGQQDDVYTTQTYGDLSGPLDIKAFKDAWQLVLERHDVLRTSFVGLDLPVIHQLVQKDLELPFNYLDKRHEPVDDSWLSHWRAQDKAQGFDIRSGQSIQGPLLRVSIIRLSDSRWHFVWTYHHVLLDGWSLPQLFNEVMLAYQGFKAQLPEVADYEQYIRWLDTKDEQQSYAFWAEQLAGFDSSSPFDALKQGKMQGRYTLYDAHLPVSVTSALKTIAQQQRCTMNVLLQAAWAYLVHRYSGFNDIVFGATVSGRPSSLDQVENMVGLFINTIPIRLKFDDKTTITALLADLQHNNVRREEHSFVSLAQIQKQANLAPGSALFESLLAFENYPLSENTTPVSEDDIIAEYLASDEQTSFPLSLMAYVAKLPQGETLSLKFGYYPEQFAAPLMQRMFGHLQQLLSALAEHGAERPLAQWQLLSDGEYQHLLYQQNQPQASYPVDKTIAQLFEQVAKRLPGKAAIATSTRAMDYQSLERQANHLAHTLVAKGLNKGEFVGIHLGRCPEFIIACLAVFKAGGAYVPLDPNYPQERLSYIVNDAAMRLVISSGQGPNDINSGNVNWGNCTLVDITPIAHQHNDIAPPAIDLNGQDLAYMIYTSGTTGNPKGVMIAHGGFINSVYEQLRIMQFGEQSRVLAYASWNFDASVIEIFDALLAGATLVLADEQQVKSPELLTELLAAQLVTHATLPPAILPFLTPKHLPALKHLMAAGEHCPQTEVARWSQSVQLYNGYGPTEASVCFSLTPYHGGDFTIGKAIANKLAYVVDDKLRVVPQGVPGELLIGGSGIAKGYHNQTELSAQKFIANPFSQDGSTVYRSGDRVKMLENGELLFLGRIDNQVKVRGHRIETAEIEAKLQQLPTVKAAAVTVKQGQNGAQLLAAIVPQKTQPLELWPSVAEFYIYDDLLYRAMATDSRRVGAFEGAIKAAVKDKVVLEVGPGTELLLTQMCVKAGARKVYAVELMEQTYLVAKQKLAQLGLEDVVTLIHGDATQVQLPEKADYCVSGIVGSIGGSEGAAKIINEVRHQLKDPANMLPKRTVTNLAAITLNDDEFKLDDNRYGFSPIAAHYTKAVFDSLGKRFDLRVCLKHFRQSHMLSTIDVMECLDHSAFVPLEAQHQMRLEITKAGRFHGFAAWLNLFTDDHHVMDILEADQSLLPIYLPVSIAGIEVAPGDVISGTMTRTLHSNGLNPNYRFDAKLHKTDGQVLDAGFVTLHEADVFCDSPFYRRLFSAGEPNILPPPEKVDILAEAKSRLAEQLPSYMVPALFTELSALPLTANGKIDYQAIAALEVKAPQEADYQAPSNEIEAKLCAIWQAALGNEQIGTGDNFFAAGGDSIIAIGVVAKARSQGLNLSVADVFEYNTIARLAPIVAANQANHLAPQHASEGEIALWPIAAHFFEQQLPDSHHFNQSVMVNTPASFGKSNLKAMLRALIERHDSLRLVFSFAKDGALPTGRFVPLTNEFIDSCIVVEPLPEQRQQISERCNDWQSRFELNQGPLLRAILLQDGEGSQSGQGKLCLILHHLIVDGVSWRILLSDLKLIWQQLTQQQPIALGSKTHSLQQWRLALETAAKQLDQNERHYWQQQLLKPAPDSLNFAKPQAAQNQEPNQVPGQLQSCELMLDSEQTKLLTGPCNDAHLTRINELLLAALHVAWRHWSGERVLPLAMESHGRDSLGAHLEGSHIDLSETVGWFTALYPLRLEVGLDADIGQSIEQIKQQYRQLPNNGIGFGLLKYIAKDPQIVALSARPCAAEVVFNYLGQMDQALSDDGPFADARLATGYNASPNQPMAQLLAINGMVSEGKLSFALSFDASRLHPSDVERLASHYKQALFDLIDHCQGKIQHNRLFEQNSDLIVTDINSMLDEGIEI